MSYSSRAAQLMRRGGHSRPLDYFLLHPLPDSSALTLQAAARVPFPFLRWALLLPVSEPLHTLLLGSAGHPVKAVTLNSCRSQLKYLPRKPPLTFTDIAPFVPCSDFLWLWNTLPQKSAGTKTTRTHCPLLSRLRVFTGLHEEILTWGLSCDCHQSAGAGAIFEGFLVRVWWLGLAVG